MIFSLYSKKITIDKSEIDNKVENIKNQNLKKKQFKLSEIEISIDDMTDISSLEIELKDFIKKTNFDQAAKKFSISPTASDGGNLGWIDTMSLSKDMLKVIEKMKLGEISNQLKNLIQLLSILFQILGKLIAIKLMLENKREFCKQSKE